ncbi:MAG TPA: hypothetical protein VF590_05955 [Isosphaeraceae bacterium]
MKQSREAELQYQERAVQLLGRALGLRPPEKSGLFWRTIDQDRELDPIRSHPGYSRFKAKYQRESGPGSR